MTYSIYTGNQCPIEMTHSPFKATFVKAKDIDKVIKVIRH